MVRMDKSDAEAGRMWETYELVNIDVGRRQSVRSKTDESKRRDLSALRLPSGTRPKKGLEGEA